MTTMGHFQSSRAHRGPKGPRIQGSTRAPGVQWSKVKGSTRVHRPLDPWTPRSLDPWSPCPGPGPAHGLSAACYMSYKLRWLQFRSVCVVLAVPSCSSLLSAKLKTDNEQESNNCECSDGRLASKRHLQFLQRSCTQSSIRGFYI